MRPFTLALLSWGGLIVLALSLAGWRFALDSLDRAAGAYAGRAAEAERNTTRDTAAARVSALARDTAEARARLDALGATDVLAAAKTIESVGRLARVALRVTGASSAGASLVSDAAPLHAVAFSFEARGAFARILHATELLGALPVPATLEQFDMERVPAEASSKEPAAWRLTGQIRLLTKATTP